MPQSRGHGKGRLEQGELQTGRRGKAGVVDRWQKQWLHGTFLPLSWNFKVGSFLEKNIYWCKFCSMAAGCPVVALSLATSG